VYIKRLEEVDLDILKKMVNASFKSVKKNILLDFSYEGVYPPLKIETGCKGQIVAG
jgi:hypothetical protein